MNSYLVIGDDEMRDIANAIAEAKKHPVSFEIVEELSATVPQDATTLKREDILDTADRRQRDYPPQRVMLGNLRCAFSYEEQPVGMVRHLSVSSPNAEKGYLPGPLAMKMICEAFGFGDAFPPKGSRIWTEEYEPNEFAVNVIQVDHEFSVAEG